jgi:hypothetical protein
MKGRCIARENQAYVVVDIKMSLNERIMKNPFGWGQIRVPCKARILDQFANYQLLSNNSYSMVPVPLPTRSVAGLSSRRPRFDREQSVWVLWWTKREEDRFLPKYFNFP